MSTSSLIRAGKASVRGLLACACLACACPSTGSAAVILRIDISNLAATTITATGAPAQNDDIDDTYLNEGFLLLSFFSANPGASVPDFLDSSTLYSPGGRFAYTLLFTAEVSGTGWDLNIAGSGFTTQDFSTSEAAFTGSATVDFSGLGAYLVAGTTGDVLAGDAFYNTVVLGQYEIIPEPGAFALAFAGLGAALIRRRRF